MTSRPSSPVFWAAVFVVVAALLLPFFLREPQLYDNDSYFHIAIARAYGEEGILDDLPWARFSLLHEGFGDKEVLFHLLLAPFTRIFEPVVAGQVFLALLLAAVFATVALLARPAVGNWAVLLPFGLAATSTEVAWRWVRLRPESLSLILLLWALWAIGRRRYLLLGLLGALYALGYTAFHAFGGLCVLIFAFTAWARRRLDWGLVVAPALGIGVGLLAHPHFPKNVAVWVVQSFEFFRQKAALDVGTEIFPNSTDVLLMVNLGWFLLLAVLWRSSCTDPEGVGRVDDDTADAFGVAAVAFALLYLLMSRFSLYAMPFVTLWLLLELRRRGRRVGARTRLPGRRGEVPVWAALALCAAVAAPEARRQWQNYSSRVHAGPAAERIADREALAAAIPAGATVAATWQQTPVYMLWAPQGRYLNVLDPVFMATADPARHELQQRVFRGAEPDLPLAVGVGLDSRFLAVSAFVDHDLMRARLASDPRVAVRYERLNRLWEILPGRNAGFLLDWSLVPAGVDAVTTATFADGWTPYPRHPSRVGAALEGFVDTSRFEGDARCRRLAHRFPAAEPTRLWLELAPMGPATVAVDGEERLILERGVGAVLGRGSVFPVDLDAGGSVLTVRSCRPDDDEREGFYLTLVLPPEGGEER